VARPRGARRLQRSGMPAAPSTLAQVWLDRRHEGVAAKHFDGISVRAYSTMRMEGPACFADAWTIFANRTCSVPNAEAEALRKSSAAIIYCNVYQPDQMRQLVAIFKAIQSLGPSAPDTILVPHSVSPEHRSMSCPDWSIDISDKLCDVTKAGLENFILGEPRGFDLVLALRARICTSRMRDSMADSAINELRLGVEHQEKLCECVHDILWLWVPAKLPATEIPHLDASIPENLESLEGYKVGPLLGEGKLGKVHLLHDAGGQVVKIMEKHNIKDIRGIKEVRRMLRVMEHVSDPTFTNPHIVKFHEAYHSRTHIFFRMEDGGRQNLYQWLRAREKSTRLFSAEIVGMLIMHAVAGVSFLHHPCGVCHRDIKPENFTVKDTSDGPVLKIVDFDLSVLIQANGPMCRTGVGTMPFMAPEVVLRSCYNALAADVWSLGVVILEMLCGLRIMERTFELDREKSAEEAKKEQCHPNKLMMLKIVPRLSEPGAVGALLQKSRRPQCQEMLPVMEPLLDGMVRVDACTRLQCDQCYAALKKSAEYDTSGSGGADGGGGRRPPSSGHGAVARA